MTVGRVVSLIRQTVKKQKTLFHELCWATTPASSSLRNARTSLADWQPDTLRKPRAAKLTTGFERQCGAKHRLTSHFSPMTIQNDLARLSRDWETLGRLDARWGVLADNEKRGGGWDDASFFGSGRQVVGEILDIVREAGGSPARTNRALDFGCGVGRLSRALTEYFSRVDGVDVAASMIAQAEASNPAHDRISFHHNPESDLRLFGDNTFDLVFSFIVLQHIPTPLALSYVREFVRVAAPGATIVFQAPYRTNNPGWKHYVDAKLPALTAAYRGMRYGAATHNDVYTHDAAEVTDALTAAGATIARVQSGRPNDCAGWLSALYVARIPE
jgi:SAM-dependent methyltransferase